MAKRTCIKGGFHDVHALFYIVVNSVHTRYLIKCLLGIFLLVVYLTHRALHVHFLCIGHTLHIATSCTHLYYPCHALVYILFLHPSMSCLSYALWHLVMSFVLSFIFSFILHPSCIILLIHSFISCLLFSLTPLSIRVKKGESIL